MIESKNPILNALGWLFRVLPFACMLLLAWLWLRSGRDFSIDDLVAYTPKEPLRAVLFLWLAFALKSLSLVFPVMLLFAVSGQLFTLPVALAVNTVGIAITLSVPYWIGRFSGKDLTQRLLVKYPKLREVRAMRQRNNFFFSFLTRAIGILACDVLSLYFGNTRMPYLPYVTGAVLGFMPDLVCATILGDQIQNVHSPAFWITVAVNLLCCAAGFLGYLAYRRRLMKNGAIQDET